MPMTESDGTLAASILKKQGQKSIINNTIIFRQGEKKVNTEGIQIPDAQNPDSSEPWYSNGY